MPPVTPILQPGVGAIPGDHYLRATPETVLWGRLPCKADAPVLRIRSGQSVTIDTVSHEGILEDHGKDPLGYFSGHGVAPDAVLEDAIAIAAQLSRDPATDGPHVVTGPVFVEGAELGDVLRITVEKLAPRVPYGVISNRHGKGALVGELPRGDWHVSVFTPVERRDGRLFGLLPIVDDGERVVSFPLAPFLGTMGVAVAGSERPHSVPPGPHGGNIDINLLVEGTALYLPVQVEGALAYVGDPHFAQGDGEVALTALEASLRATLRFDVIPRAQALAEFGELAGPLVRTPEYLVPTGLDPDLNEAMRRCVRAALTLLEARYGMAEHLAYAYLSAATDFNISQVVDIVCGVHARIRVSDFEGRTDAAGPAPHEIAAPAAGDGPGSSTAPAAGGGPGSSSAADPAPFDRTVWRTVGDPLWQGAWEGPLAGLTVAVKDLFAIAGYRIGAGNPAFLDEARPEKTTAPAVADLLRGGASLRGIARTDEFAYSIAGDNVHYGTPPNPAAPGALPGGSSSGPAAAVALGHAEVGLATDTAGSIRVPASYQGLWGLRTTHGLVPRQGLVPLAQSFDTVGWLARDGETLQRVADWCLSYDSSESTENVFGASDDDLAWRFLVPDEVLAAAEPQARAAFEALVARLQESDTAEVDTVSIGDLGDYLVPFRTVQGAEAWRNHGEWVEKHPGALGPAVAERFRAASVITSEEEDDARRDLAPFAARLQALTADAVLLMPTVPGPAPRRTAAGADIDAARTATLRMTTPAAVAGLPSLSVPLLRVPAAGGAPAPVGACLISRAGTDVALVRLARRLAEAVRE
ncbi:Asp-tRNA(Asn)/Glu-tRNA(Gln) amidotransferase A subunit family amidase/acetamidase/formamidase [Microbacterium sp. AK009]|nr:Asp-tRNA(Asn)/Glu-tRNA(Gln) amidotransferase A subunit family amidase/acetamidase/formamidase [Microbacterium sp. AK009]